MTATPIHSNIELQTETKQQQDTNSNFNRTFYTNDYKRNSIDDGKLEIRDCVKLVKTIYSLDETRFSTNTKV